ncbi:bifunctional 2-polyprenyl-6-hydroxyphenol methylase/3-demethylubiquinol 3-O-methyltransferase UbiG [Planomonospora sp. ID82291]|uniref:class I SAM-dependent methyltransferase n=1 Tax=Planomonospora sp. ID82291 TaxID=2738136 RepID=UPI0018C434D3|nr:class I SAM-dependent methyltransferase [Planomonospora sp. ID82291]MBG0813552.1 class I SAM-dependent methyltransferase [Planomonospora sp. ID82291]
MHDADISRMVELEDRHWWFRERRAILRRELRRLQPRGRALDVGAAGGGNTRVLAELGYDALVADASEAAVEAARRRGLKAVHADARDLPMESGHFDVVTAFDVLEHIAEDHLAAEELARVLKPGGTALIAVPCDMSLWSAHDDAVGHVRRYAREDLVGVVEKAGLTVERVWSWNVLLRPVVVRRRRNSEGNDLTGLPWIVNAGLTAVIVLERHLPVKSMRGVSLFLRARKPA